MASPVHQQIDAEAKLDADVADVWRNHSDLTSLPARYLEPFKAFAESMYGTEGRRIAAAATEPQETKKALFAAAVRIVDAIISPEPLVKISTNGDLHHYDVPRDEWWHVVPRGWNALTPNKRTSIRRDLIRFLHDGPVQYWYFKAKVLTQVTLDESLVSAGPASTEETNAQKVTAFLNKLTQSGTTRVTKTQIWKAAGYKERTEFQKWQAGNGSEAATRHFERILAMTPEQFRKLSDNP